MRRSGLLVAFVLALAACGGSDGANGTSSVPSGSDDTSLDTASTSADTGSPTGTESPTDGSGDSGSARGLPPGGTGTVVVGGNAIQSEWVGNCIIDPQFDPDPEDLDITAGLGGIQALFLEISHDELNMGADPFAYTQVRLSLQVNDGSGNLVSYEDEVFVSGSDGVWYRDDDGAVVFALAQGVEHDNPAVDPPPLSIDGDQLAGTVVFDSGSEPVEVTFDLTFIEPVDCSL